MSESPPNPDQKPSLKSPEKLIHFSDSDSSQSPQQQQSPIQKSPQQSPSPTESPGQAAGGQEVEPDVSSLTSDFEKLSTTAQAPKKPRRTWKFTPEPSDSPPQKPKRKTWKTTPSPASPKQDVGGESSGESCGEYIPSPLAPEDFTYQPSRPITPQAPSPAGAVGGEEPAGAVGGAEAGSSSQNLISFADDSQEEEEKEKEKIIFLDDVDHETFAKYHYQVHKYLAAGRFSVYEVGFTDDNPFNMPVDKHFACKVFKTNFSWEDKAQYRALMIEEVMISSIIFGDKNRQIHPNITKNKHTFTTHCQERAYIVMELSPYGTLHDHIHKTRVRFTGDQSARIVELCADASLWLKNTFGIAHCDIKPENVLLFDRPGHAQEQLADQHPERWWPKLADFSHSRQRRPEDPENVCLTKSPLCTLGFSAPEPYKDPNQPYNAFKADVYSLAVLLLWLLQDGYDVFKIHRQLPVYNKVNIAYVLDQQKNEHLANTIGQLNDMKLMDLVAGAMDEDPESRLSLEEFRNHVYFQGQEEGEGGAGNQ